MLIHGSCAMSLTNLKQGMCDKAVRREPYKLDYIPDQFKTKEMRNEAICRKPCLLEYVPDWLVTQEQVKIWHDDDYYCDDNKTVEWYEGYKNLKARKAQIKEELMPSGWHPSRRWDWCVLEDEKKETEKLWKWLLLTI